MITDADASSESTQHDRSSIVRLLSRVGLTLVIAGFATLDRADVRLEEAVNRVDDRELAACAEDGANQQRLEPSDYRSIVEVVPT